MIINAEEVFEMAAQIERNGRDFYLRAASMASTPEASALLSKLAKMEEKHEKLFLEIKDIFLEKKGEAVPDFDGQALSYIRAMAEGQVFSAGPIADKLKKASSLLEIYKLALEFEKSSLVFFSAIKKLVPGSLEKEKIDFLINEELGHIAIISREMVAA